MTSESQGARIVREVGEHFADNARERRQHMKMSQAAIARIMKVVYGLDWHQTVLAKIESRERAVKLPEAYALARVYELPLQDLIDGVDLDRPSTIRGGSVRIGRPDDGQP